MTTEDTVYQGRVHLVQPEQGFRAGTDSLLLAAALSCRPGGRRWKSAAAAAGRCCLRRIVWTTFA